MKEVFGYVRVSTAKQGEGASLSAQRESIERYSEKHGLKVVQWFEEKETAAKQGRPLFAEMLKLVKRGKAEGVIMHKIDRSARNFKDWHAISTLMDEQKIFFAHENLDLQSRGGRLAADIQAVFATDYIRNLRDETVKGLYGRLKQGVYPFAAPAGYVNNGGGQLKTIDPVHGPLVRRAFELYATRKYTLESLSQHLEESGLRQYRGRRIGKTGVAFILSNPFYIGIMRVKGQHYEGMHEPLITTDLYEKVQGVIHGKSNQQVIKNDFIFRKRITCKSCGYSLIGERQKGHIYYRCHTKACATKTVRQTKVEDILMRLFKDISLLPADYLQLEKEMGIAEKEWAEKTRKYSQALILQGKKIQELLSRLTDCYVEGGLDKETYEQRKFKLLSENKSNAEMQKNADIEMQVVLKKVDNFLELSKSLAASYEKGNLDEKRELVETVTSNLMVEEKKLIVSMKSPFHELCNRDRVHYCAHSRDTPRTLEREFSLAEQFKPVRRRKASKGSAKKVFEWLCCHYREEAKAEEENMPAGSRSPPNASVMSRLLKHADTVRSRFDIRL